MFAACKDIAPGVTVNHVFTVATALALAQLQPKQDTSYYGLYLVIAMINLRPYLREPFSGPKCAAASYNYLSGMALGIDALVPGLVPGPAVDNDKDNFYKSVKRAQEYLQGLMFATCDGLHEHLSFAPSGWTAWTPKSGQDVHAIADTPVCNLSVSFIGDFFRMISTKSGIFHTTKTWISSEGFGADVPIFLQTWDGQFELSSMFDNRYHKGQSVKNFMYRIVDIVGKYLCLAENHDQC